MDGPPRHDVWGFAVPARASGRQVSPPPLASASERPRWPLARLPSLSRGLRLPPVPGLPTALAQLHDEHRARARTSHELRWHAYWRRVLERCGDAPIKLDAAHDAELRALVRGGISVAMRGSVWPVLCGLSGRLGAVSELYHQLLADCAVNDLHAAEAVVSIELDIERTWPGHERMDANARAALRRVLIALARAEPDVGYCQGLNEVAAALLLFAPNEESAFGMLLHLLRTVLPPAWYSRTLAGSIAEARVLGALIAKHEPVVGARMAALRVEPSLFCTPWFLCLFIDCLPFGAALRVWDCVLLAGAEGPPSTRSGRGADVLLRLALALLRLHRPALLRAQHAGAFARALADGARATHDVDALIRAAFSLGAWSLQPAARRPGAGAGLGVSFSLAAFPSHAELDALRRKQRELVGAEVERTARRCESARAQQWVGLRAADGAGRTAHVGHHAESDAPEACAPAGEATREAPCVPAAEAVRQR